MAGMPAACAAASRLGAANIRAAAAAPRDPVTILISLCVCVFVLGQCGLPVVGTNSLCKMHKDMRECSECHRRLQDHSFTNDTDGRLCNACHNKRTKRVQSGRGISSSSSVNHTFVTEEIPIPSSVPDPFAFIPSIKSIIADSL